MYPEFYGLEKSEQEKLQNADGEAENSSDSESEAEIFRRKMQLKTEEWLQRPAAKQVDDISKKDAAYVEGNYDYNIWYDKYLTDTQDKYKKRMPSLHKCNPEKDAGFTKANSFEKEGSAWFCVYFARGSCTEGVNCRYYHRVPNHEDCTHENDNIRDIFGRARHASHKNDMTGIGSFNKECRTVYITGVQMTMSGGLNPQKAATQKLYSIFSPWGEIEDIGFSTKGLRGGNRAFIKYAHRYYAEFAREALSDQMDVLEGQKDPLIVRWAVNGSGNPFDF